jgi:hypothetical protein
MRTGATGSVNHQKRLTFFIHPDFVYPPAICQLSKPLNNIWTHRTYSMLGGTLLEHIWVVSTPCIIPMFKYLQERAGSRGAR